MFAFVLLVSIFAPLIARYDYAALSLPDKFQAPTFAHFLGTDRVGRDIWSRTLYGGRVSLAVGFAAASISTVIGVILGSVSGYYRGMTDQTLMRFTDVVMTFPTVVLILTAAIYLGQSIASVIFLIGTFSWPGITRLVRGQVLSLREQQYVLASRALGANNRRIIVNHILPNVVAPLLASVTFAVNGAILLEAGLSFLGVGIPLPTPSWGNIAGNRAQPGCAPGWPVDLGAPGGHDSADCAEH